MASECCNILKSVLASLMGQSTSSVQRDADRETVPVEYLTTEEDHTFPHEEESTNYQTIVDQATIGFLVTKTKGKGDQSNVANTAISTEQVDKLRLKLKSVLLTDEGDSENWTKGTSSQEYKEDAFAESLKKLHFITHFSTEIVR